MAAIEGQNCGSVQCSGYLSGVSVDEIWIRGLGVKKEKITNCCLTVPLCIHVVNSDAWVEACSWQFVLRAVFTMNPRFFFSAYGTPGSIWRGVVEYGSAYGSIGVLATA